MPTYCVVSSVNWMLNPLYISSHIQYIAVHKICIFQVLDCRGLHAHNPFQLLIAPFNSQLYNKGSMQYHHRYYEVSSNATSKWKWLGKNYNCILDFMEFSQLSGSPGWEAHRNWSASKQQLVVVNSFPSRQECRASVKDLHLTRFWARCFTSFQDLPASEAFSSVVHLHVILGRPLHLVP
jgi:hypothetical protein